MKLREMRARVHKATKARSASDLVRHLRKVRDGWVDSNNFPHDGFHAKWAGEHRGRRRVVVCLNTAINEAADAEQKVFAKRRAKKVKKARAS